MVQEPSHAKQLAPIHVCKIGLTDPLTKKTVPDHHNHGGLQQHPQGGHQEGLQPLPVQAREGRCS